MIKTERVEGSGPAHRIANHLVERQALFEELACFAPASLALVDAGDVRQGGRLAEDVPELLLYRETLAERLHGAGEISHAGLHRPDVVPGQGKPSLVLELHLQSVGLSLERFYNLVRSSWRHQSRLLRDRGERQAGSNDLPDVAKPGRPLAIRQELLELQHHSRDLPVHVF